MNYDLGIIPIDALGKIQPDDVFNKDMAKAYRRMIKAQQTAGGRKTHKAHLKAINGKRFDELNPTGSTSCGSLMRQQTQKEVTE